MLLPMHKNNYAWGQLHYGEYQASQNDIWGAKNVAKQLFSRRNFGSNISSFPNALGIGIS
ncbi:hypothetical protein IBK_1403 [Dehalococcoides mccartyi IBARAKI]|nr:hypothetical protein IBK_1403 [Dehalococcoides mccartyi IBARAKI]